MHRTIAPAILYFGTPVVLIGTRNPDGTDNLAPMSSVWWLGWRAMLGLAATSRTTENLQRTGVCVLNLPSVGEVAAVDRLALTTGSDPVPPRKQRRGYRYVADKFGRAGLTPLPGEVVAAPRVLECPVHLEVTLQAVHEVAADDPQTRGHLVCLEVRIERVHVGEALLSDEDPQRIDPDRWRPLLMSFQHFYGLGPRLQSSRLATIPEALYRPPGRAG